jgi:hypothetical protein
MIKAVFIIAKITISLVVGVGIGVLNYIQHAYNGMHDRRARL